MRDVQPRTGIIDVKNDGAVRERGTKRMWRRSVYSAVFFGLVSFASHLVKADPQTPVQPSAVAPGPDASVTEQRPPISSPKVTFEEAIRRAMERNPNSEIAMQEIRRSTALAEQVRANWLPTLSANGAYTRLDSDRVFGGNVMTYRDTLTGNITLTVPIIQAHSWAASARANETVDLAKLSAIDAKKQIAITTGRAFLTVIAQRRVLESSVNARDTALAHEQYAKSRLEGGIGNRLDAVRAGQERASSDALVQTQTLALERTQEALGVLLGESSPVDVVETNLPEPPTLAAALSEAEKYRSDVIAQRQRVEIARKAVRDDYTDYLPLVSAVAQPFLQTPATPTVPGAGWQAQLILAIPLYDGGARYGLAHERAAVHEEEKVRLDGMLRQARSDVRISFEGVRRADAALVEAREASKLAAEALSLAQDAYSAGTTSNLDVIDAERRSLDAATGAAVAEDAARQARLDLLFASGRFP